MEEYNLTIQQENIWMLEKLHENTNINNITGVFSIKKILNIDILNKVMNEIVKNNDVFRMRIHIKAGKPIQKKINYEYEEFEKYKLYSKSEVNKIIDDIKIKKINIINNKLYNITIIQDIDTTYVCVKMHHIISDAWTLGKVAEQIKEFYNLINNNKEILKKPSYISYIEKDNAYRVSQKYLRDKEFWLDYVKKIETINNFEITNIKSSKRIEKTFTNELFSKIELYCEKNKISLYTFFLSTISIYFMKCFGNKNIVIGTPFLNRGKRDNELDTLGMFIATLPIHIELTNTEITFLELCRNITTTNLSCYKHSKFPYYEIQNLYKEHTNTSNNLYEIAFSYQINRLEEKIDNDIGKTEWLHNNSQSNSLLISYVNHFGEHKIYYDFLTKVIKDDEITQIHHRILNMISKIIEKEDINVSDIYIFTNQDISDLKCFNNTGEIDLKHENIITRFKQIVKNNLNNIAIKMGNLQITYDELDQKSDYLANNLLDCGFNKNTPFAVILDKSIEMIITFLGILKIGAFYIPILPEEDLNRIEYILKNSEANAVITSDSYAQKVKQTQIDYYNVEDLIKKNDRILLSKCSFEDIAYLIYTSGTTGNPKGVVIEHKNIISFIYSINADEDLKFISGDKSISLLKPAFDASAIDIYSSLLNGGTLVLAPKEQELNPKYIVNLIEKEKITRCFTVHKWIEQIQNYGLNKKLDLRVLGTGAEVLKPEMFKTILQNNNNLNLYNTYGPTETTMFVTKHKVSDKDIEENYSPIGSLIPYVRAVVVNDNNEVMPINVKGELVIYEDENSAQNISRGYYKLHDITAQKFIELKLPYNKICKGYKTGDIAKINSNLELEFLGRKDDFVKINGGYLVSLNEIENIIQKIIGDEIEVYPLAVPVNNTNEIVIYIVKKGNAKSIKREDIERNINENMTYYMRPKRIIEIKEFPRNNNGKIDREKLLNQAKEIFKYRNKYVKPTSELEKNIYEKIKKIINRDFSINDDFEDDLGLDSLNISSLYTELGNENLSIQDLYNYSTVKDLANMLKSEQRENDNLNDNIKIPNNSKKMDLSCVLLTGMTGFLGCHLLKELVANEQTDKIYCLIRGKVNKNSKQRFNEILNKYFDKKEIEKIKAKTIVVNGDLTKYRFGIENKIFNELKNNVKSIINPAANVKHIGKYKYFYRDNVITVNNIINMCKKYNIGLVHISTLSLNGFRTNSKKIIFTEDSFNIGQSFGKSPYLISKFEAEKMILKAINSNEINAKIFRVGNIMPRVSDGIFQINYYQNAFMLAVKELLNLKIQSAEMLNSKIYFTPVDECCLAILSILNSEFNNNIYHIESDKGVEISKIIHILNLKGYGFETINFKDVNNMLYKNYNIGAEHLKELFSKTNNYYSKKNTIKLLNQSGFEWKNIDNEYLINIINIAKRIR